jgi:signal transduction histidine kinase
MSLGAMKLRNKFFLSFGAVLMLGTLVAALMFVMMLRSSASYKHVLDTDRKVAESALTIEADKLKVSDALRGRLLHPYGDFGDQEVKNLNAAYAELSLAYGDARRLVTDPALITTLSQIEAADQSKLKPLEQQILSAIERQESAEAERLYFDEYLPARNDQQMLLDHLNSLAAQRITSSVDRTTSQSRWVAVLALGLTALLIVAGCTLSYYLTKSFETPIKKLMEAARAIASGDLNVELTLHRKDELGEMAQVLNQMVTNLRQLNINLVDQVRRLQEAQDELAQTQGQLITQEKMAALGRLIAGVAHELNNPISFVYSNTVLLRDSISALKRVLDMYDRAEEIPAAFREKVDHLKTEIDYDYLVKDVSQAIEDSHEGARRVRDIVLNLRTLSRLEDTEVTAVNLSDGIDSTAKILGQYYKPGRVELHRQYGDIPRIECYSGQLSQVWMNLMVNAAQAMGGKGDLWVTTELRGERVVLTFKDSGPGMPPDVLMKIFDPFFTTKPVGDGTGLGLSIVHSIIERHGGDIRVQSEVGVGTTFTVELPIERPQSSGAQATEEQNVKARSVVEVAD